MHFKQDNWLEDEFRQIEEEFSLCVEKSEKAYLEWLKSIKADINPNYPEDLQDIIKEYHALLLERIISKKQSKNSTK